MLDQHAFARRGVLDLGNQGDVLAVQRGDEIARRIGFAGAARDFGEVIADLGQLDREDFVEDRVGFTNCAMNCWLP